jgi:hypothetical protein
VCTPLGNYILYSYGWQESFGIMIPV